MLKVRYYRNVQKFDSDLEYDLNEFDSKKTQYFYYDKNRKLHVYESVPIDNNFAKEMYTLIKRLIPYYKKGRI